MILVTGASGQIGREIMLRLGDKAKGLTSADLDITDCESLRHAVDRYKPKTLINCAAYTQVDKAEDEIAKATAVNAIALGELGKLSRIHDFRVVHFSTDYVFPGSVTPYTESDVTGPLNVYGESKLRGESLLLAEAHRATIIRTAWIYSPTGNNFLNTMLRLGASRKEVSVVFDQIGSPTLAGDVAQAVVEILPALDSVQPKTFNISNEGVASWYDFASAIFKLKKINCSAVPIRSSDYPTKARRPSCAVLDKSLVKRTFGIELPHWIESLESMRS